jgi:hypothetical protein
MHGLDRLIHLTPGIGSITSNGWIKLGHDGRET